MSILDVLRSGVAIANKVTKPLQATIQYRHFLSNDGYGAPTYVPDVSLPALTPKTIVDWKQKQVRTQSGILSVSRASVMFLDIAELVAITNGEGISDEDMIILPDGTTGPILDMSGFIDAGTTLPLATEVWLG